MATLVDSVVRRLLRTATVTAVSSPGPAFRRVDLRVDGQVGFSPGCKVQAWMGGTAFRTFTPFAWTGESVSLLVFRADHGGPATAWVDGLATGSSVDLFGPRKSLALADLGAPPVVVGDETSIAVTTTMPARAATLFEASVDIGAVLAAVGITDAAVVPRDDLPARVVDALRAAGPGAPLVLTGQAQTIRAVRGAVKDAGLSPTARVKTYWDPNRSGLD